MEDDEEDPQLKLEREIDEMFERTDEAAHYIMNLIVEEIKKDA